MADRMKKGFEYELCIARLDTARNTIRVSSIDLSTTAAFVFGSGYGFCGLGICSIQPKESREKPAAANPIDIPLATS